MSTLPIRVMVAGSRPTEARAFEDFLERQPGVSLVGSCNELQKIPSTVWRCIPHVMLLYLRGTQLAVGTVQNILAEVPEARLLLIVPACTTERAAEIIEAGACGVIAHTEIGKQGLRAIRAIRDGEIWGSRKVLSRIVNTSIRHTSRQTTQSKHMQALTGREGEIVKLLQTGSSNKEIAQQLYISDKTVKTHLHNIFAKLNVNRRHKIFPKLFS
jgi:NarL family two-component system response regulator LiaR